MVTAKTCLRVIVVCMAIFAGLQLILESFDVHTTYKYTLPSNSALQKAAGSQVDGTTGAVTQLTNPTPAVAITWNKDANPAPCEQKYHINGATFGNDEEIYMKYTADGITLYDCLRKHLKSGDTDEDDEDDDDDDDKDWEKCPKYEVELDKIRKGRFKEDHVQRVLACPILSSGGLDCPADGNSFAALVNLAEDFKYESCQTVRTDKDCAPKINVAFNDYKWMSFSIVLVYLIGSLVVYFVPESVDIYDVNKTNICGRKSIGAILIALGHVMAIIFGVIYLVRFNAISDSDSGCIGEFMEDKLGWELEDTTTSHQTIIVGLQLATTVVGVLFFALGMKPDENGDTVYNAETNK